MVQKKIARQGEKMDPMWIIPIVGFGVAFIGLVIMILDRPKKVDN